MKLIWNTECYKCGVPLEPRLFAKRYLREYVNAYQKMRPLFLGNNQIFYTFVGLKVERVCYCCFKNKRNCNPRIMGLRETGRCRHPFPKNISKTQDDILLWYSGLKRYLSDIEKNVIIRSTRHG